MFYHKIQRYTQIFQRKTRLAIKLMKKSHKRHFDDDDDSLNETQADESFDTCLKRFDFDDFKINKIIGTGDLSKIYSVTEKSSGIQYAAKFITDRGDPDQLKKTMKQMKLISKISFPSIHKYMGYCLKNDESENEFIIISELYPNGCLQNMINDGQRGFSKEEWDETKKLINLIGIASGMNYLHKHDIIHRNLKPENIFLDEYLFPKIGGFGFAVSTDDTESMSEYVGTPVFMAPEVFTDSISSKASDVYSFAILMYMLLTLDQPFIGMSAFKLQSFVISGNRPKIPSDLPKNYANLIESCWAQDPGERPTFEEIISSLTSNINDYIDIDEVLMYCDLVGVKIGDELINEGKADHKFNKVAIDFGEEEEFDKRKLDIEVAPIELSSFQILTKIGSGSFGKVYKIIEKKTGNIYAAKVSIKELFQCSDIEISNHSREVNLLSILNSPLVLKFIGHNEYDFKNLHRPTVITEYVKNGSLQNIIEGLRNGLCLTGWDETKRLICFYGIASGMAYLHKHDILHRDLKPENIFLDEYLFPKIGDLGLAKKIKDASEEDIIGTPMFVSPEIIEDNIYTKAGDVYSFAMLVYSVMTLTDPFNENNQFIVYNKVTHGYRPEFPPDIPDCYRSLIKQCWSQNPEERPTFDEITEMLKTNPEFITSLVDENEFIDYIGHIGDEYDIKQSSTTNEVKKIHKEQFRKVSFDIEKIEENDHINEMIKNDPGLKESFLDLQKFEKLRLISKGNKYKIYEVKNKETGKVYSAKISTIRINNLSRDELIHLSREVNIIAQLTHPSFLKFIGYSPKNFKNKSMPVIVSELPENRSLEYIVNMKRKGKKIPEWNDTKRLINIYGIAAGMAFLHSNRIIHRNLALNSIFLNEYLLPKIGNFSFSTRVHSVKTMTLQSTAGIQGNNAYSSPEILQYNDYSEASDVYAFAMIVYELMTLKVPFKSINSFNGIYDEVVKKSNRPKLDKGIPEAFRKLIEICWSQNPRARPTFKEIEEILINDDNFITENVNKNDFMSYINMIQNSDIKFNKSERALCLNDLIEKKSRVDEDYINDFQEDEEIFSIEREIDRLINIKSCDFIKINLVDKLLQQKEEVRSTSTSKIYRVKFGKSACENDFISLKILKEKVFTKDDYDNDDDEFKIDTVKIESLFSLYKTIHQMNHPNIIKSFGFFNGDSKHEPLILQEYFSKNLKEAVKSLDDIYLVSIIYEICHAMMMLHSNNLIHRNLNPENIFIDSNNHVKIADFDISNLMNVSKQIKTEKVVPLCMSPQLLKKEKYDEKTDVFSFGIIMFFILTRGKGKFLTKDEIISGQKVLVHKTINLVSYSIIYRCLSFSPDERPSFKAIDHTIRKYKFILIEGIESKIPILQKQIERIIGVKRIKEKK